jgi:O-antigen/teichoic acid export membrane protein
LSQPGGRSGADAARETTGRSVLTGGLWYLASYGIPQGYTIVLSIVAARFLGPSGMGLQSFIAFVATSTTTVLASSMFVALMRYIGETIGAGRSELVPGLLAWAWRIEAAAAVLGGAVVAAAAVFGAEPSAAWVLAGVVCAAGILHTVPTAVLIGLQRFRTAATVGLVTGLVGTVATAFVLWAGAGVNGLFAVEAGIGIVNLIWTGTLARRHIGVSAQSASRENADLRRRVARFAVLSSLGVVLDLIVSTRSEFFVLDRFSTHPQIAYYSIAFSAVATLRLIPRILGGATAPAFATLYGAGSMDRIRSGYSRSLRLLILVSLPLTATGLAFGPELIEEIYGRNYAGAGLPLRVLMFVFPITALSAVANSLITGFGHVRLPLIASGVAAIFDVGLALALIPRLDAAGAAIANGGGQAIYALLVVVFASRLAGPVRWRPAMATRTLLASAASGGAGWYMLSWLDGLVGVAAGVLTSIAVFGVLAALLRVVPADDAVWLDESFGRRLGGSVGRLVRLWSARPSRPQTTG